MMNVLRNCAKQASRRCFGSAATSNSVVWPPSSSSVSSSTSAFDQVQYLRSQPSHYVIASLMGKRYVLAPRDLLTVPRLKDARVGDRVILSRIHEVGSRDYTLRGESDGKDILPDSVCRVEATVVEHTKGAMERIVKFKRRKHYQKTVKHKQPYTRLRIGPIHFDEPQWAGKTHLVMRSNPNS